MIEYYLCLMVFFAFDFCLLKFLLVAAVVASEVFVAVEVLV
jgi:hypothetical protein